MGLQFVARALLALVSLYTLSAQAQIRFQEELFAHLDPSVRTGIEVEFSGLTLAEAAEVANVSLRGRLVYEDYDDEFILRDREGRGQLTKRRMRRAVILDSVIGRVEIKVEDNSTTMIESADDRYRILELISEPITVDLLQPLQKGLYNLRDAGAWGTERGLPVSIQVNVEIGSGEVDQIKPEVIVALMRTYSERRPEISKKLKISEERQAYVQPYSEGLLKKIGNRAYKPTLKKLFNDVMYRQMLELSGAGEEAWSLPLKKVRRLVLRKIQDEIADGYRLGDYFTRVMKFSPVKVASILVFAFPEDPLSKLILSTEWIKAIPAAEFRDRGNDFELQEAVRMSVGFMNKARLLAHDLDCASALVSL